MSLTRTALLSVALFSGLSILLFIRHEYNMILKETAEKVHFSQRDVQSNIEHNQEGEFDRHSILLRTRQKGFSKVFEKVSQGFLETLTNFTHSDFSSHHDKQQQQQSPSSLSTTKDKLLIDDKARIKVHEIEKHNTEHELDTVKPPDIKPPPNLSTDIDGNDDEDDNAEGGLPLVKKGLVDIKANVTNITELDNDSNEIKKTAKRGKLMCNNEFIDSEVIYWREVSGDREYESPISPHGSYKQTNEYVSNRGKDGNTKELKYLSFAYDHGGWNNMRMSMECILVMAHAMGRTLVVPPYQHLYLLNKKSKKKKQQILINNNNNNNNNNTLPQDLKQSLHEEDELGFEDFFDVNILRQQQGLRIMSMSDFLEKEALTGHLKGGKLPPGNRTDIWGTAVLWPYLDETADVTPEWANKFLAMPSSYFVHHPSNNNSSNSKKKKKKKDTNDTITITIPHHQNQHRKIRYTNATGYTYSNNDIFTFKNLLEYPVTTQKRYNHFANKVGSRNSLIYYDETLQEAHHIHIPGDGSHRLLIHHYSFAFFADVYQQKFYRRFVRDYIRYKDEIHCAGHDVIQAVRRDARAHDPVNNPQGDYYSLHIRRGDFQFKEVKLSAAEIWRNLHFPNGTALIPNNSFVYISTDDPDGLCVNCLKDRKPCESYPYPKPVGCPGDTSWNAFYQAGWKLKFLRDYLTPSSSSSSSSSSNVIPALQNLNPNFQGMVEVIICSRSLLFAGTVHSTFTGYIHRIRGFHGLGSSSYYHSHNALMFLQDKYSRKIGYGWWREWTNGWEDDEFSQPI